MLYHIVIIITFAILAYAVIVLFRKFAKIRKRSQEWQSKESEFINKLIANGDLKPGQLPEIKDFIEGTTLDEDDSKLKTKDNELGRDDIRSLIFREINRMSDEEIQQFYQEFRMRLHGKPRRHDRQNLILIVDYSVNGKYYRDAIRDISESGVFITTSQTFSEGDRIQMTFMSPDYQRPFKIKGEIARVRTDGVGVKFKMESQVQEAALKSFMNNVQDETVII